MSLKEQAVLTLSTLTAIFGVLFNVALALLAAEITKSHPSAEGLSSMQLAAIIVPLLIVWMGFFAVAHTAVLKSITIAISNTETGVLGFLGDAFVHERKYWLTLCYICIGIAGIYPLAVLNILTTFPSPFVLWLTIGTLVVWHLCILIVAVGLVD